MGKGLIMKAIAGYYYVYDQGETVQCRARGVFRKHKKSPLVGDYVAYQAENLTEGYIMEIEERKNELIRPPVANIDQAFLVFSAREPDFNLGLLDRFLVHIEQHDIKPIIIVTKIDLMNEAEYESLEIDMDMYKKIGYEVVYMSTKQERDTSLLVDLLSDQVTVIAGQSGVGKSSLLNIMKPEANIETSEISKHLGRGKHTTRHVELIRIGKGLIADTPGFSSLDFAEIEQEDLRFCFPEFIERMDECKFRGCLHDQEPNCAVKEAVKEKEMSASRYQHYLQFLEEIKGQKRRY